VGRARRRVRRLVEHLGEHGGPWRFSIAQKFQVLDVNAAAQGRDLLVRASRLRGEQIKLVVAGVVNDHAWHHLFTGALRGERIDGQVTVSDGNVTKVHPWHASRAH
jgi:hypothetical protein